MILRSWHSQFPIMPLGQGRGGAGRVSYLTLPFLETFRAVSMSMWWQQLCLWHCHCCRPLEQILDPGTRFLKPDLTGCQQSALLCMLAVGAAPFSSINQVDMEMEGTFVS